MGSGLTFGHLVEKGRKVEKGIELFIAPSVTLRHHPRHPARSRRVHKDVDSRDLRFTPSQNDVRGHLWGQA